MSVATGRSSFAKRQRDMAKKARAAAKREKRLGRDAEGFVDLDDGTAADAVTASPTLSNDEIMARVQSLHERYDNGQIDLDSFDEQRASLMAQISVD